MTASSVIASWMARYIELNDEARVIVGVIVILLGTAGLAWVLRPRVRRDGRRIVATLPTDDLRDEAAPRYSLLLGSLFSAAAADFFDVQNNGEARGASELQERTGIPFIADAVPRYFTGPLDPSLVLIHAMPKTDLSEHSPASHEEFKDYIDGHRDPHLDENAREASRVDEFASAFTNTTAPTTGEQSPGDARLKLYFLPYPARPFNSRKLDGRLCRPEYERVMAVIDAYPREYIVFCGAAFDRLLAPYIVHKVDHRFRVPTRDGTSKSEYRFSSVVLRSRHGNVRAGIAQSFTVTTTPMSTYGEGCRARYAIDQRDDHAMAEIAG